ncbi:archaetidylserine decarboxylase [Endozoicomonas sp.]|uniref:archaetidylserine decarboxylase n=1 Tax=Endozoicomonas sp. TaxID=1892382 RepID=UPI0028877327|nr:archaetidylserine decarboxylase [Endozoicomonas sp.]
MPALISGQSGTTTVKEKLFAAIQYVLPHHLISRAVHYFVECQTPWFKNHLIQWAIDHYRVDMKEAQREKAEEYRHFNDFFTRLLKDGARPLPGDPELIVSPADGAISQIGDINDGRIFQAKGHDYSLVELLGGDLALGQEFMGGKFATIYLSPKDYHRIHIPAAGTLHKMVHIPGRLFSVNQGTVENIPNLFARNERVVSVFDTQYGPMAVIMVGAINVASIETVWAGLVTPQRGQVATVSYGEASQSIELSRGDELGQFKLGSTAIVLFGKDQVEWLKNWQPGMSIKMGEAMASTKTVSASSAPSEDSEAESSN